MDHIHKCIAHIQSNGQLLPTLPNKSLFFCFSGFYLASNELPEKATALMGRDVDRS